MRRRAITLRERFLNLEKRRREIEAKNVAEKTGRELKVLDAERLKANYPILFNVLSDILNDPRFNMNRGYLIERLLIPSEFRRTLNKLNSRAQEEEVKKWVDVENERWPLEESDRWGVDNPERWIFLLTARYLAEEKGEEIQVVLDRIVKEKKMSEIKSRQEDEKDDSNSEVPDEIKDYITPEDRDRIIDNSRNWAIEEEKKFPLAEYNRWVLENPIRYNIFLEFKEHEDLQILDEDVIQRFTRYVFERRMDEEIWIRVLRRNVYSDVPDNNAGFLLGDEKVQGGDEKVQGGDEKVQGGDEI